MRRVVILAGALALWALPAFAQSDPNTTAYSVAIFAANTTDPAATVPIAPAVAYPVASVPCGLAKSPGSGGVIINPRAALFDDPTDPTKDCQVDISAQVRGLAPGTYKAAMRAVGANSVLSDWSNLAGPFNRALPAPTTFRVR